MDLKKVFPEAPKNIPAVRQDMLRVAWKYMKIELIV